MQLTALQSITFVMIILDIITKTWPNVAIYVIKGQGVRMEGVGVEGMLVGKFSRDCFFATAELG